jgi:hypothetical protein
LEGIEKGQGEAIERKEVPVRLYFRKVAGGRLKLSSSIPLGGSWLSYENLIREVLEGRRSEAFFQFIEDTDDFKMKKKNR